MEALFPAPSEYEVRSVIKFLNAQSIASIEIHRQHVYGHTRLNGQHISCRSSARRCLIIYRFIARTSRPVISIFSYTSRNSCPVNISVFIMTERRRWVPHWFQSQAVDFYDTGYKRWSHGMTNVWIPEVNVLKNRSTSAISVIWKLNRTRQK